MANIINSGFFKGDLEIPNRASAPVLERINYMIQKYEPECLETIMGYSLSKAFLANTASPRMQDILNGAEYTDCFGNTQKFKGLVYDTDKSLIAAYVYYAYQQSQATRSTGVNTAVMNGENASPISPAEKMIEAWNYFSEQTRSLLSFLRYKNLGDTPIYPEINSMQISRSLELTRKINFIGL